MIDYEAEDWLGVLFKTHGSVLPRLVVRVGLAAVFGGVALALYKTTSFHVPPVAHGLIGVALGLLLVFRTNASYDRFWEGRRLVGKLVIAARDLMRQAATYIAGDHTEQRAELRRLVLAYYHLAVQRLRDERDFDGFEAWLTEEELVTLEPIDNRPAVVGTWISNRLVQLLEAEGTDEHITELRLSRMDQDLGSMLEAVAGCERIRFTPVPFAYAQHIKIFLTLFCYTAPFAMVGGMGWWTPVAVSVLTFALFGIDEIGVEIEDPFGDDPNDLPLESIGESLALTTQEMLDTPQPGVERARTSGFSGGGGLSGVRRASEARTG